MKKDNKEYESISELFRVLIDKLHAVKTDHDLRLFGYALSLTLRQSIEDKNLKLSMVASTVISKYFESILDCKSDDPTIMAFAIAESYEKLMLDTKELMDRN